jgi:glycine/D-amino acid oxidase-like deaminating enzyme
MGPTHRVEYDYLIVGAGLAGLHLALRLSRAYPKASIAIAEAYGYLGGRVVTWHPGKKTPRKVPREIHWENGAGRIHSSHTKVLQYVKKYELTQIPISEDQDWRPKGQAVSTPNIWPSLATLLHSLLSSLSPQLLATHTIAQLLKRAMGSAKAQRILDRFPYRAEMFVMRADMALKSLEEEMGTGEGFCIVKEGLSALVDGMQQELDGAGVKILLNHRLIRFEDGNPITTAVFRTQNGPQETQRTKEITTKHLILALHARALKGIQPIANLPLLHRVIMCPLLRTYAIFPVSSQGPWFKDMHHTVTDSPLRYIIPIDYKKGIIMISYTDAQDTGPWLKVLESQDSVLRLEENGEAGLETAIMKEVRALFPEKKIPDPIFFKAHPWDIGCSYWRPGTYDPQDASEKALRPMPGRFPNVYMCGESFSVGKQCWMEGALDHADLLFDSYFR